MSCVSKKWYTFFNILDSSSSQYFICKGYFIFHVKKITWESFLLLLLFLQSRAIIEDSNLNRSMFETGLFFCFFQVNLEKKVGLVLKLKVRLKKIEKYNSSTIYNIENIQDGTTYLTRLPHMDKKFGVPIFIAKKIGIERSYKL